jgi:hypothetical protein
MQLSRTLRISKGLVEYGARESFIVSTEIPPD